MSATCPADSNASQSDVPSALDVLRHIRDAIDGAPDARMVRESFHALRDLQGHDDTVIVNAVAATTLTAQRWLGMTLDHLDGATCRDGTRSPHLAALANIGVARRTARQWRELALVPDDVFRAYVGPAFAGTPDTNGGRVSRIGLLRYHQSKRNAESASSTTSASSQEARP